MRMEGERRLGRRLGWPLLALAATLAAGTAGYVLIEGWPAGDAFYMSVTTVMTVGFGEVRPLSTEGRAFTLGLIGVGVAQIWYILSVMVGLAVEGELTERWGRRRMERRVAREVGHQIVCGYGRVGRQIAEELRRTGRSVVVVDADEAALRRAAADGLGTVPGNATEDETLLRAGIERAAGLITAVATDADNVFVTLSARALRRDLAIVARANNDDAIPKLRRAGATQVVSPYAMAGRQMARLALRPATVDFVESLMGYAQGAADGGLLLEDVRVADGSPLVAATVAEARRRLGEGVLLLALRRGEQTLAPPPADLALASGDVIAAVGSADELRGLERACEPGTA